MKKPYPLPASDASPGTVWFGGPISWFSITLSIRADDLDPDEVTRLLGVVPHVAQRKGVWLTTRNEHGRMTEFGMWSIVLRREDTTEWDIEAAIGMLLDRIPATIEAWHSARANARARIFVGLTIDTSNRGFGLSPDLMGRLAEFGLDLDFDIYNEQADTT